MASFPRRSQIGVRSFAESFSRQFSGRAYINGNRPKTLCNPLAWRQGQRGVTALDGSCFWIMQLKNEKSDSLRDLGQLASDSREGGGHVRAPRILASRSNVLSPYQLWAAFRCYLLGFFLTGGFFSPPLGLIRARQSFALNGDPRVDCSPEILNVPSTRRL